ncbi:IS30 family transposase [Lacticaseibacillus nasuensis]|uniref:IS30 family transposase n=1 Tax=Lacticaseibacillus nasuensis TaxID=944671 RepID=UPI0022450602|nr:IS30 family transposase [Lacticaseibacillus nasuensis]MCX2455787.1 IS30 family transposase [Lacticaseibacillus nasuensis]
MHSHQLSIRNIVLRLKRSPITISRELHRLSGAYKACEAQEDYQAARLRSHKPSILSNAPALRTKIVNLIIEHHWSPEQIAARLKSEHIANISFNTIYRDIEHNNLGLPFTSKGDTGIRRSLRPNFINNRSRIGDWELDTVIGKVNEEVLVTLVERKTRYSLIAKAKHKDAESINTTVLILLRSMPKVFVHSITPDHGVEFLHLKEVADELAITVYRPKPYSPQERDTNENTNGLMRDYFPRNTLIRGHSDEEVHQCQVDLNRRPRKVLDYQTPSEVFFDKVLHLV